MPTAVPLPEYHYTNLSGCALGKRSVFRHGFTGKGRIDHQSTIQAIARSPPPPRNPSRLVNRTDYQSECGLAPSRASGARTSVAGGPSPGCDLARAGRAPKGCRPCPGPGFSDYERPLAPRNRTDALFRRKQTGDDIRSPCPAGRKSDGGTNARNTSARVRLLPVYGPGNTAQRKPTTKRFIIFVPR